MFKFLQNITTKDDSRVINCSNLRRTLRLNFNSISSPTNQSRRKARKSRSSYQFTLIYQKYIPTPSNYYAIRLTFKFFSLRNFHWPQSFRFLFLFRSAHSIGIVQSSRWLSFSRPEKCPRRSAKNCANPTQTQSPRTSSLSANGWRSSRICQRTWVSFQLLMNNWRIAARFCIKFANTWLNYSVPGVNNRLKNLFLFTILNLLCKSWQPVSVKLFPVISYFFFLSNIKLSHRQTNTRRMTKKKSPKLWNCKDRLLMQLRRIQIRKRKLKTHEICAITRIQPDSNWIWLKRAAIRADIYKLALFCLRIPDNRRFA